MSLLTIFLAGYVLAQPAVAWQPHTLQTDKGPVKAELGRIQVPERRSNPTSRTISLAFVRIPAATKTSASPVVYLDGGPGGSGVSVAQLPAFGELFRRLNASADVILLSQRGTGLSDRLGCAGSTRLPDGALLTVDALQAEASSRHRACAESLRAKGADLAGYTSEESADDIEDVRRALGAERLSLVGFSYGTHLGFAVLRRHGSRIERAVFLGSEGPDDTWKLPSGLDAQIAAIDALSPGFSDGLRRLLAQVSAKPLTVVAGARTVTVGPGAILYLLRRDIGDTNDIPWMPAFVRETLAGDFTRLSQLLVRRLPSLESGVQMMAAGMDCASAAGAARLARIAAEEPRSIFGAMTNFPFPGVCAAAGLASLPDDFRSPLRSPVPALFVSGTLDANTPPSQADAIMKGFERATHLVVENAGHESTMIPAVIDRVVTFLKGGQVASATLRSAPLVFR